VLNIHTKNLIILMLSLQLYLQPYKPFNILILTLLSFNFFSSFFTLSYNTLFTPTSTEKLILDFLSFNKFLPTDVHLHWFNHQSVRMQISPLIHNGIPSLSTTNYFINQSPITRIFPSYYSYIKFRHWG
jgi:hypothetical protein